MMTKTRFLILFTVTLLFSGCALNNYTIEQPYQPVLQKFDGAEKYSVSSKVSFQPVFADDPKVVAVKKNAYGIETARIYLFENVEGWLQKAFDKELNMAGFNLNNSNKIKVTLKVEQLFVEPWVGFLSADLVGIFKAEAKVQLPKKDSYYIRRFVMLERSASMVWTDGKMEEKFLQVAQKGVSEIVKEISWLILEKKK